MSKLQPRNPNPFFPFFFGPVQVIYTQHCLRAPVFQKSRFGTYIFVAYHHFTSTNCSQTSCTLSVVFQQGCEENKTKWNGYIRLLEVQEPYNIHQEMSCIIMPIEHQTYSLREQMLEARETLPSPGPSGKIPCPINIIFIFLN